VKISAEDMKTAIAHRDGWAVVSRYKGHYYFNFFACRDLARGYARHEKRAGAVCRVVRCRQIFAWK